MFLNPLRFSETGINKLKLPDVTFSYLCFLNLISGLTWPYGNINFFSNSDYKPNYMGLSDKLFFYGTIIT